MATETDRMALADEKVLLRMRERAAFMAKGMADFDNQTEAARYNDEVRVIDLALAALRSEAGAAMREPQATGWLVSAGWKEGETRGPVIEFVVDTEAPSTGTYGDVWNHARYELHRCADQSGRSLPLQPEGGEA